MKIILLIIFTIIILFYLSYKIYINKNNSKIHVVDIVDIKYYNENNNNEEIIENENIKLDHYVLNKLLDENKNIDDYQLVLNMNDQISIISDYENELKLDEINTIIEILEQDEPKNNIIHRNLEDINYFNNIERAMTDNIHDSNIQKQTVQNYNSIIKNKKKNINKNNDENKDENENKNEDEDEDKIIDDIINDNPKTIEEYIKNRDNSNHTYNIYNQIKNRNAPILNLDNKTEIEVLNDVWNSINEEYTDKEENKNKKEFLINAINDCSENGEDIFCPSGVATRAINYDLTKSNIISSDILHVELLNTASELTSKLLNDETYKNSNDNQQKKIFKEKFVEKVKNDYKDSNIDEKVIKQSYEQWLDEI